MEQLKDERNPDQAKLANLRNFVENKTSNVNSPFVQNENMKFIRHSEDTLYKTEAINPKQQTSRSGTREINYQKENDMLSSNR